MGPLFSSASNNLVLTAIIDIEAKVNSGKIICFLKDSPGLFTTHSKPGTARIVLQEDA